MEGVYVKTEPEPIPHASTSEPPVPLAVPLEAQPCRLCANIPDRAIEIYSTEGLSNQLSDRINEYLPVKVSPDDKLPLCCCWTCVTTLLSFHELVVACVEAEKRLQIIEPPKPILVPALPDPEPDIVEFNDDDAEMMDADDGEGDIDGDDDYEPENEDDDEESEEETKPIPGTSDDTECFEEEETRIIKEEMKQTATKQGHENKRDDKLEDARKKSLVLYEDKSSTSTYNYYKCIDCAVILRNSGSFTDHYNKMHLKTKPRSASDPITDEYLLKRNVEIKRRCRIPRSRGKPGYKCDRCENHYYFSMELLRHYLKHLPVHERTLGIHTKYKDIEVPEERALEIKQNGRYVKNGVVLYECYFCNKKTKFEKTFIPHVYRHEMNFTRSGILDQAKKRCKFADEVGETKFRCDICQVVLKTADIFIKHYKRHMETSRGVVKPSLSKAKRRSLEIKRRCTFVNYAGVTSYRCFVCNTELEEVAIIPHYNGHERKNELKEDGTLTDLARRWFIRFRRDAEIRKLCTTYAADGTAVYRCDLCMKTAKSEPYILKHYNIYHKNIRYLCKICDEKFSVKIDCINHIEFVHQVPPEQEGGRSLCMIINDEVHNV